MAYNLFHLNQKLFRNALRQKKIPLFYQKECFTINKSMNISIYILFFATQGNMVKNNDLLASGVQRVMWKAFRVFLGHIQSPSSQGGWRSVLSSGTKAAPYSGIQHRKEAQMICDSTLNISMQIRHPEQPSPLPDLPRWLQPEKIL